MRRSFLCKVEGRLGSGSSDLKEAKILNRVVQWSADGLSYEADPRHVELLAKTLSMQAEAPRSASGAKNPAGHDAQEEEEEELVGSEARLFRACAARAN